MAAGFAAVAPTWNRKELLARALDSLRAQTFPPDEIVVVDNGSTDGAAEMAEARGARVLRMGRNAGFAAAVNHGLRETRAGWVAAVNNDVELAPDYFARLADAVRAGGAWFAAGRLLAAARPDTLDGAFDALSRGGCALRVGHGRPDGPPFDRPRRIFSAPWTAALFRAALFEKTGLLEESFESYLEDVDFGARCARLGLEGVYVPEAVGWHQGSATLGTWSRETVRRMARNQALLAARHLAARDAWHIVVGQGMWGLAAARRGAGGAWLRGKWEGLSGWRAARKASRREGEQAFRAWMRENERMVRAEPARYWRLYSLLTPGESI